MSQLIFESSVSERPFCNLYNLPGWMASLDEFLLTNCKETLVTVSRQLNMWRTQHSNTILTILCQFEDWLWNGSYGKLWEEQQKGRGLQINIEDRIGSTVGTTNFLCTNES